MPFAIAAIVMLVYYVSEPRSSGRSRRSTGPGRSCLTAGLSSLLVGRSRRLAAGMLVDQRRRCWCAAVVLLVLFVIREHHAADPILPMDLMTRPVIAASLVGSFLFGGILFGLDTYIPLYIQGVRGGNATSAGPGTHAAFPGVGDQRGPGRQGRGSPRLPPRGDVGSAWWRWGAWCW